MHKFLCILACIAFIAMVSCEPIRSSAVEIGDFASYIDQYRREAAERLKDIQIAVNEDLANGNLDATTDIGKEYLKAFALQQAYIYTPQLAQMYEAVDYALQGIPTDYFTENPTIDISSGGGTGLYRSRVDGLLHQVVVFNAPPYNPNTSTSTNLTYTLCSSDEFTITCSAVCETGVQYYSNTGMYSGFAVRRIQNTLGNGSMTLSSSGYFDFSFVTKTGQFPLYYMGAQCRVDTGSPLYLDTNIFRDFTNSSGLSSSSSFSPTVGWYGQSVELPPATVDSTEPWDYYNINILPVVRNVPDRYIIFPNGYAPTPVQDPTEPTYPPGDLVLPPYGELVTEPSSYFVTDESGETVTDESGEPLTETTMIPVTVASSDDAVYRFRIPTLPNLQAPSEIPTFSASLPERVVGLSSALFRCVHDVLDASGVLGIMPFLIGIAVVIYVIYKIGG